MSGGEGVASIDRRKEGMGFGGIVGAEWFFLWAGKGREAGDGDWDVGLLGC